MSHFLDTVTLGPPRRRRRMTKRLAELDRLDIDSGRYPPRHSGRHRLGALVTIVVLAAGVTGIVLVARNNAGRHLPADANPLVTTGHQPVAANDGIGSRGVIARALGAGNSPRAGVDEQLSRILPAPPTPPGSGGYRIQPTGTGVPARYDPCRPIHYVIRNQNTPPGGDDAIRQAVSAVSKATGLRFIADGTTTETPSSKRPAYLAARYGNRWAPVLIAWTNPTEISALKGDVAGLGGSWSYSADTRHGSAYVSGSVSLDTAQLVSLQASTHGDATEVMVIEHELGHLVGLAHVNDPTQIMYASSHGHSHYEAGDLRGLAIEGSGACHPEL